MRFDRAVILHGKPRAERFDDPRYDPSRANWLGWLADELGTHGVDVVSLRPKTCLKPDYHEWSRQINGVCHGVDLQSTVFIAHSLGCAAYLRWLSSQKDIRFGGLVMVAPWIGRRPQDGSFSKFEIDKNLGQRSDIIVILNSKEDEGGVPESIKEIREAIACVDYREVCGYGHFVTGNKMQPDYDLGNGLYGSTFPKLMEVLEEM
jgi:predicted alpha/beta hydrolase family esterase